MTILKQKKSHVTLTLFLALIGWLLMLPLPASAAAQAVPFEPVRGSFGIELTCKFADEEKVEHTIEDYQAYGFVLLDAAGRYVQADLAPDASFYLVSGSTVQGSLATQFRAGNTPNKPQRIVILGLAEGEYKLRQTSTAEGYMLLSDSVSIRVSQEGSFVDGYDCEHIFHKGHRLVPFTIVNVEPFDLPLGYQDNPFLLITGITLMLVASAALIVLYVIENSPSKDNSSPMETNFRSDAT